MLVTTLEDNYPLIGRRRFLLTSGGALIAAVFTRPALARSTVQEALAVFANGAKIKEGRIRLEIPPLVENGNLVGATVTVDSPMTEADHVKRIALFNEKNPQADMAVFHLGPRAGRAEVSTRLRLATTQVVTAVCEMSDGGFWASKAHVIVTLAACVETL